MSGLEMSAVKTIMCWENLPDVRVLVSVHACMYEHSMFYSWTSHFNASCSAHIQLKNGTTEEETVLYLKPGMEKDDKLFHDSETGVELEVIDSQPFVEWLATHYKDYGAELQFITDKSQEGHQFVKGFGGVGGFLRWKVDFTTLDSYEAEDEEDESEDDYADIDAGFI